MEDNVCYDHLGHGYFLEDGAESGNLIAGNLGLRTRNAASGEGPLPTDQRAATFWITNPDNTVRGNAAAGSDGFGFWYALPASPTGLSTGSADLPRTTPLREFSNNVAHSNRRVGLNVDDGPMPDGNTEVVFYSPRSDPADANSAVIANFTGLTAYKHSGRAVWLRGRDHRSVQLDPGRQRHRRDLRVQRDLRGGRAVRRASRRTTAARSRRARRAGATSSTTDGWGPTG